MPVARSRAVGAVMLALSVETIGPHAQARPAPSAYYVIHEGEALRVSVDRLQTTVAPLLAPARRRYGSVALSAAEAGEILRGNEAARDQAIARECGVQGRCGGAIHAAAIAMVADVQRTTERSLQALLSADIGSMRGTKLVLVTSGLPYREEPRTLIARVADRVRDAGASLVIVRLNSSVLYAGYLRDAVDRLGARVPRARVVRVLDEQKLAEVAEMTAEDAASVQAAPAPREVQPLAVPPPTEHPASPAAPAASPTTGARRLPARADAALDKASAFVADFERTFAAVIWHEAYVQEERTRQQFRSSGTSFNSLTARRQLESELLFVWLPAEATWLAVRDVIAVDGRALPAAERRLPALLANPTVMLDQLRSLSNENGRFNIGKIVRTFNEPTLALLFLDRRYRSRFDFSRGRDARVNGTRASAFEFVERNRPTVIRNGDRDVPAQGTLWIEPATGRVLQTSLEMVDETVGLRGRVSVIYKLDARLGTMVPIEMRESYVSAAGERIDCTATYSDFRRFETAGRLVIPQ